MSDSSIQRDNQSENLETTRFLTRFIRENIILIAAFIMYSLLLLWDINEPWIGIHDFNGAFFGTIVKTALKEADVNHLFSYWHHPPLLQVLLFIFCQMFGTSEAVFRIVPILFSLGNIILLYAIALKEFDKKIANLSIIFFAFMPMNAYFGRMVAHESGSLFFILLTFYLYLRHVESLSKRSLLGVYSSFLLGTFIGWPGYYVFGAIFLHALFYHRSKKMLIKTAIIFLLGVFSFYFTIATLGHFSDVPWETVFQELIWKGETRSESSVPISDFLDLEFKRFRTWFGVVVLLACFVYFYSTSYNIITIIKEKKSQFHTITQEILKNRPLVVSVIFLLLGSIHVLLFMQGAYVHEYWMFYLSIGLIIPCAVMVNKQQREFKHALIVFFIITSLFTLSNLHKTDDTVYYELGSYIDENTDPENYVFVTLPQIGYYSGCNYYLLQVGTNKSPQRLYDAIRQFKQKGNPIRFVVIAEWLDFKEEMDEVLINEGFTRNQWSKDFRVYKYNYTVY